MKNYELFSLCAIFKFSNFQIYSFSNFEEGDASLTLSMKNEELKMKNEKLKVKS